MHTCLILSLHCVVLSDDMLNTRKDEGHIYKCDIFYSAAVGFGKCAVTFVDDGRDE